MKTLAQKFAKADQIKARLIADRGMASDFAEAVGLYMVLTGNFKLSAARMPVFLAGEAGAAKFRAQIEQSV